MKRCVLSLVLFFSMAVTPALAEQALVAVAANFVPPFREVAMEF
jgi:molybdate transport system substrate-binding protein